MLVYTVDNTLKTLYPQSLAVDQPWWKNCIIYQIYPRSFQDGNGDGVGDLQGIISRLDYLQALGVDAIWLSPIYPSPMEDFGYDVANYCDIDPLFGSLETFEQLVVSAHDRDIKVILDYVPNHTSNQHSWFVEARSSRDNPKRDWYIWRDAKEGGGPPNNWISFFGGSVWTWDAKTDQYYLHMFSDKQPDLNWRNPQVVEAMQNVIRFWLDLGVDGLRMDAITMLIKHAEMPDMPPADGLLGSELLEKHIYIHNQPETHNLLRGFRQIFDEYNGHRVMIGETGDLNPEKLASFYGDHLDEMHLPFNFILMHMPWQADVMKQVIEDYYTTLPQGAMPNFVFGNHDISRLATRYGWKNHRSVGMLLLTLGGVATLYYGDELGMTDGFVPDEMKQDLVMAYYFDSDNGRDSVRTPMQWDAGTHGGFTTNESNPWLPLAANYEAINVTKQLEQPKSTLKFYQSLISLRKRLPALQHGSIAIVEDTPQNILAYLRQFNNQRLLVVINFADSVVTLNFSHLAHQAVLQLSSTLTGVKNININQVVMKAYEGLLLQLD